jgi:RNA polymerase sigma factor (sigma-70 family)
MDQKTCLACNAAFEAGPKRTICTPCRDKEIEKHIPMSYWFAYRYWGSDGEAQNRITREETQAIALFALTEIAGNYDPNKGALGTILRWYVRKHIQDEASRNGGAVIVPPRECRRETNPYKIQAKKKPRPIHCIHDHETPCVFDSPPDDEDTLSFDELLNLTDLSDDERFVLDQYYRRGRIMRHIGEDTGRSYATISRIRRNGISKLRTQLLKENKVGNTY